MILYGPKRGGKVIKMKRNGCNRIYYEHDGPNTNPKVKNWCHGRCYGLLADLDILVDVIAEELPKHRRRMIKGYAKDISRDFAKLIKGLAKGHSS